MSSKDGYELGSRRRRATLKDVAAQAGVSFKTASRVINGEPGASDATRQRVLQAARQIHYRKNAIAGSIRRTDRRTASIGLIVDDIANPFTALLNRVIQDEARQREHLVLAGSTDRSAKAESMLVAELVARQVDGLIIVPSRQEQNHLQDHLPDDTPVVFVDGLVDGLSFDAVLSDNVSGVRAAVDHLVAHGHRDIAYVSENTWNAAARERFQGFTTGLAAHGIAVNSQFLAPQALLREEADSSVTSMLNLPTSPTAIISGYNVATLGVLDALYRADRQESIAFIGFDDLALAPFVRPALTVVAQDISEIGRTACDRLFSQLARPERSPGVVVRVPVSIIPRGSGEIMAPGQSAMDAVG